MKIEMKKEDREKLLGILPFDNDATEEYVPEELLKGIPDSFKPIITLRPWTPSEKSEYKKVLTRMSLLDDKTLLKNQQKVAHELADVVCLAVIDIKNLIDLGSMELKKILKEDGHVTVEFFEDLPELFKGYIQARISAISGISRYEKLSLSY